MLWGLEEASRSEVNEEGEHVFFYGVYRHAAGLRGLRPAETRSVARRTDPRRGLPTR
jgi:hypothetical protein